MSFTPCHLDPPGGPSSELERTHGFEAAGSGRLAVDARVFNHAPTAMSGASVTRNVK
jgi:hypothetical protein